MAAKDALGRAGEERATAHLVAAGCDVLERNWRCAEGEIDIVAHDRGELVFVEVKTRRALGFGHPFEAITARKLSRLHRLAMAWVVAHPDAAWGRGIRIDAVAIIGEPDTGVLEHLVGLR